MATRNNSEKSETPARPRAARGIKSVAPAETETETTLTEPVAEKPAEETQAASRAKVETAPAPEPVNPELEEDNEADLGLSPKTFLTPYVLLMLRDSLLHGYAIWEKLTKMTLEMGIPSLSESDRATIYRMLRQLEKEGKIQSHWETNTDGPARRVYSLTDAGENFLRLWAIGLKQYRQSLDFFFQLYSNPFGLGFGNNNKGGNK